MVAVASAGSAMLLKARACSFLAWMVGGWVGGWLVCEAWVDGVMVLRVGFININDMYNYAGGKGVVYAYEAYEAK